jgi:uncharacterized protein YjlB
MADESKVRVRYVGRHTDGVVLPLPGGDEVEVAHGATVEVPAGAFAEGLLAQPANWQPSGKAAREVAADVKEAAAEPAEKKGG